jgi:AAA15 family ATPase/GTPase
MENDKPNHLIQFSVENFKRFNTFQLEDIGQFNLILGDNGVGKTTLLESLLIDDNLTQYLSNLESRIEDKFFVADINRYQINYLELFFNDSSESKDIKHFIKYNDKDVLYSLKLSKLAEINDIENSIINNDTYLLNSINKLQAKDVVIFKKNDKIEINVLNISSHTNKFSTYRPLIPANLIYSRDLVDFYSEFFQPSTVAKKDLIEMLCLLEKDLEDIEIVPMSSKSGTTLNSLSARIKGKAKLSPFTMLGDGTSRILRILLEIAVCKNKRLMIDEIDNGIHYSHMADFLKTVLKAADKNNVQLFFTTHSKDCIYALKTALSNDEMRFFQDRTRTYTLRELPGNNVNAYKYNYEEFEYAIERDIEIRGGAI